MKKVRYKRRDELETENIKLKAENKQLKQTIKEYEYKFKNARAWLKDKFAEIGVDEDDGSFEIENRTCRCGKSTNKNWACDSCGGYPYSEDARITIQRYDKNGKEIGVEDE